MKNDKKYDTVWYRKHEKEQKKQKSKIIQDMLGNKR